MSILDLMAKLGDVQKFIDANQEKFSDLAATLPATLDSWTRGIIEIRDGVARLELSQARILAILDPTAIQPEITFAAQAWAADDPRNIAPLDDSGGMIKSEFSALSDAEKGYTKCLHCGHVGCIEAVGSCANCGAKYEEETNGR